MNTNKHILVCGAGSIGKRHISNLKRLGATVSVWRSRKEKLNDLAKEFSIECLYSDIDNAISNVDAVVVATATDHHISLAKDVLKAGRPMFLEKPVSHNWEGVEELVELADGAIVEVGCQFRADPNLITLAKLLHQEHVAKVLTYRFVMGHKLDVWRKEDYRKSYSSNSARGGGALLDLIHQIDLALWFFGPVSEVNAVLSKVGELEIHGEDVANLLLTHASGVTGHIQLDMCSPIHRCEWEIVMSNCVYRLVNKEGILRRYSSDSIKKIYSVSNKFERNDMFINHMNHFLKRMDKSALPPLCSLESGVKALKVALNAKNESN